MSDRKANYIQSNQSVTLFLMFDYLYYGSINPSLEKAIYINKSYTKKYRNSEISRGMIFSDYKSCNKEF